ncbi:hypothetical protein MTR67_031822 [Solanum verrucosum]|uniref:Uncharacterized protein n=1 Tax=Solanum verrucosum TaxID=315347 RepID=A0AAF0U342_SOLVR|nr:hypothetical protein MTR67_031822 [Solanum verrucosum]
MPTLSLFSNEEKPDRHALYIMSNLVLLVSEHNKKDSGDFFQQRQNKHVITTPPNLDTSGDKFVPDTERDRANTSSRRENPNNNITRSISSEEEDYGENGENAYYHDDQDPNEDHDLGMSFDSVALHKLDI